MAGAINQPRAYIHNRINRQRKRNCRNQKANRAPNLFYYSHFYYSHERPPDYSNIKMLIRN